MNSPVNEIFKSLTSLQKELNEQNKVNVKEKNLEKVKQFLLERKGFLDEDFKSQEQNYIKQGNEPQIVKSYIERFKKIKDKNYKQLNDQIDGLENVRDRKNIDSYKTFKELEIIVDYVGGQIDLQGASLGSDIEIDAKPIYENDVFQIYYADSPRACIKYKGNIPYGWCVSQREGNMYYTYRYKPNEPSFYFVKIKDRTKKELGFFNIVGNVFNGQFKDKYHFFVLQTLKGAKIGDTKTKQYIVTSAMNDGDIEMSWDDIVKIEPRIANLQDVFKSVELSPEDKEFYDKYYEYGTDDNTFCKFDYVTKRRYLDVYIMPPEKLLTDTQFKCLPEDLMNLYIGFGVGLSESQFELIKTNKNLLKRYQQITERKFEEFLKNKNINFNYTELLTLPENKRKEYIMNLGSDETYYLISYSIEPEKIINLLGNKGKEFIMNLDSNSINSLLNHSKEPEKIIDMLNKYRNNKGKEFIMNLNSKQIDYLLKHSKEPQKIINMLINIGGKEFIMNLDSNRISSLLVNSKEPEKIINLLGNKGKEFIMNLHSDGISWTDSRSNGIGYLLLRSKEPEKIINLLGNKGKEFIMNLDWNSIKNLYFVNKEAIKQILQQYGKLPKEEIKTPVNEIFKSLTSLQEELNEQNKVNVKKRNLEKVKQFLLEKQLLIEKDNRQIIVNKMGLAQEVADYAHNMSNKYSLWIANLIKPYITGGLSLNFFKSDIDENQLKKIIEMFKDDNKPSFYEDISELDFQRAKTYLDLYEYIKQWRDNPNTPTLNLRKMDWYEARDLTDEWYQSLKVDEEDPETKEKEGGKVSYILDDKDKIIHEFSDNFYWVLRQDSYCKKSEISMGHCGTTSKDMYLFRLIKNDEEFITIDWHPINKYVNQIRGKKNSKPKVKYYPYIIWLIADSGYIHELKTSEEANDYGSNFKLSDLNDVQLKYVLSKNPNLFNKNNVYDLLQNSKEPEKLKQILQQYGKLPKEETTSLQEEVNFNSRFKVKNQFVELSKEDLTDLGDEIISLINNAYKNIGGHFEFKSPQDLLNTNLTYWVGNDNDEDPNSDVVIGGKETNFGTKLTTMGQDGTMKSKADALQKLRTLLRTKGFYIEADSFLVTRIGLPPITDEDTIKNVIGKSDIVFNSDGSYQRNIKGHLSNKFLIGVPKYSSKAPLDEQDLEEARRNPEVNYDPTISQQIGQFVNKYKGQEDLIFVSFRSTVNVTFINPKNDYSTPTGLYTYPWQNFYEKVYEKNIKNYVYPDTGEGIPFQGNQRYLFMYKLKSNQGILTNQTTFADTIPYAKKLFNIVKSLNNGQSEDLLKLYIKDYQLYITAIYNENDYSDNSKGDVHKFWILLYEVALRITKNNQQDTVANLCRAIGINGFADYNGIGFIHTNEPHQAVFFRGRGIFDDIKIIDTESSRRNVFKPSSIDRLLGDLEILDSERIDNIISNVPNTKVLGKIIDKLLLNKTLMSKLSSESFQTIFEMINEEKRNEIINKVLSKENILPKLYFYEKIFKYASDEQQKVIIKIIFKNFKNQLIGSNIKNIISNLKNKEKDGQIIKDKIMNFIVNNKESFPGIYLDFNFILFIFDNISRKYHQEIETKLLNYREVVYDIKTIMMMISSDEKQQEVFIDDLLKNKNFLEQNISFQTVKNMSFLLKNGNLTKSSLQKIVDKIVQIKPSILRELLNKNYDDTSHNLESNQEKSLLYIILKNTSYNIDSLVDNLSDYFTKSPSSLLIFLCFLSNPKKFVDEKIGDEKMRKIFKGLDSKLPMFYLVDNKTFNNAKNKEEIIEIYKKYVTDNSENQTPVNEIFKSLTSLQEELNEQNKVNVKQRNLEKVKQFLLERKGFLDEDFKSQEQKYIKQGNEPQIVKSYIERFRKIRDKNYKQLNDQIDGLENVRDRKNIDSYKTFKELETIVDYVGGQIDLQGASLGNDIEIDAKPIYENDVFQIYYADSPRACIKYKGSIPYGWCVSRDDSSNMYYTYRYKSTEPAFYFVKVKDRTKKELGLFSMVGNVFNGQFKDKYHFFVLQTLKGARIGDTTTKQYVVTSAMNDADIQMSWDEIVAIEPRIANLQEIFKPVELKPEDREFYKRFRDGTDDNTFCKLDYTSKRRYLDIYVTQDKLLSDKQFKCLPEDLMNLYIGFGVGLYENEFELIKSNKNLLKRYQQITERKLEEYLKERRGINFKYTELLILPEDKRQQIIMKLDFYDIYMIFTKSTNPQGLINILGEKGKEFIMGLNKDNIYDILKGKSQENSDKIINTIFNINSKEFIMKLDYTFITYLLSKSSNPQGIIDILGEKGKEFIMNLNSSRIIDILNPQSQENRDKIINMLFNVGGKDFVMNNRPDRINDIIAILLRYSSNPQEIMNILNEKRKEFIMNLDYDDVDLLLKYSPNPQEIMNILSEKGKEFIMNLDTDTINNLLRYSPEPEKIITAIYGNRSKEFIMKLHPRYILYLLVKSSEPEKFINILGDKFKDFISYLDYDDVDLLLGTGFSKKPEKIKQILQQYGIHPKEKTPVNEIFKSLTSLQEELTEQRKLTIKETNLMKVQNFIKKKKNNQ